MHYISSITLAAAFIFYVEARSFGHPGHDDLQDPRRDGHAQKSRNRRKDAVAGAPDVSLGNLTTAMSDVEAPTTWMQKRAFEGRATFYAVRLKIIST